MTAHGALLVLTLIAVPAIASAQDASAPIPSIVTSGEATIRRAPDRAFVTAAVETRARTSRDAQRQNAEAMTAVQQRVTSMGIRRDAVRTLGYTIRQEFDYPNGRRVPRDYVARNALEIRIDTIDRVGEILDAVVAAGATNVDDIRFDLKDRTAAEREALRLAVADARGRAEAVAAGAGRTVDRVLRIEDSRQEQPRPFMSARALGAQADQAATPIQPGEIEIRAHVVLTVAIK